MMNKMPELLCPAGSMESLRAALHFGADAVYGGMKRFGLRAFAGNFDEEQLKKADAKFGENLLIFPEQPRRHGASIDQEAAMAEPLRELYTGFAQLGRLYYQACSQHLRFFPMYIHRQKKTLCIGEPVIYKHLDDAILEKQLISKQLYQALRAMEKQEQEE